VPGQSREISVSAVNAPPAGDKYHRAATYLSLEIRQIFFGRGGSDIFMLKANFSRSVAGKPLNLYDFFRGNTKKFFAGSCSLRNALFE
jgi:hypothetical protein